MIYIIFAIVMFGLLIAVHELGHFFVAKLCGVRVNEFSIGMGPSLLKKQGKETLYSLRLFPIGGFCAMEGEDEQSTDPRAYSNARGWKRFLILLAGPGMNFLFGLIIILALYVPSEAYITTEIAGFTEGCSAAEEGYLQEGDRLIKIDGHRVSIYSDVKLLLSRGNGETADLVVRRDGELVELEDVPMIVREVDENGRTVLRYGIYFATKEATFFDHLGMTVKGAGYYMRLVWFGLVDLLSGGVRISDLSGPIGIVGAMSEMGQASANTAQAFVELLYFAAFIAVNLAVMNLLPIPALDGGRLFFLILNGLCTLIFRRSIPQKYETWIHLGGMVLLLALMAVVAVSDVIRLVGGG